MGACPDPKRTFGSASGNTQTGSSLTLRHECRGESYLCTTRTPQTCPGLPSKPIQYCSQPSPAVLRGLRLRPHLPTYKILPIGTIWDCSATNNK